MKTHICPEDFETGRPGKLSPSAERPNGKILRHKGGECWLIVTRDEPNQKNYALASLIDGMVYGNYTADQLMALVNGEDYSLVWPMRVQAGVYVSANEIFGGR